MSDIALRVENLGKKYVIRHQQSGGQHRKTLAETIVEKFTAPFRQSAATRDTSPDTRTSSSEEFWALKDVSFQIKQGEAVGIIGRNGAGKSTLLKLLSRITEPSTGSIQITGRVASLLEVGTGFHQELTGRENIYLNGAILGMSRPEIKGKFDEIVEFAEVEKFLDTPVKRYSSGMYVRLAFAVAAHLEPEILIVDEVLAVGDFTFQQKCLGKLGEVGRQGRTVVFVSHQMDVIQALCRTCICLSKGGVVNAGKTRDIVAKYLVSTSRRWTGGTRDLNKPVSITGFRAINGDGGDALIAGEPCLFELEVHATEARSSLRIAFGVDDQYGRRIFTLDSSKYNVTYTSVEGKNVFTCRLPHLYLKPDRYRVHLYVGDDYQPFDYVDGDADLTVISSSIYPNPKADETHGPIMLPQQWL